MSEVPELSEAAQAFLADHAQTGEPTADELARVQARLDAAAAAPAAKPRRRLPVPGEWLAVAAVLVALVAARGVFVLVHERGDARQHALDAYRTGDVEGALERAKSECRGDDCAGLEAKLAKAASLTSRIGALTPAEKDELGRLDAELAPGGTSAIALQLKAPGAGASPEQLVADAQALIKAREYDAAARRLEKCVALAPAAPTCRRVLGSTYARIAARDADAHMLEKARAQYEKFVELAPADDEYVPKVQQILDAASKPTAREPAATVDGPDGPEAIPTDRDGTLVVKVGGSGSIDTAEDIQRVAIGDAAVADVKVGGPRKLIVEGVEPGKTTLLFWLVSGARQGWLVEVRPK